MEDYDRTVIEFYGLSTPFPTEWPEDKDDSDESGDEYGSARPLDRQRSRFGALEKAAGDRRNSLAPGSGGGRKGMGNLVQADETDPLGSVDSVVRTLKSMGLPVQDDIRLRESNASFRSCDATSYLEPWETDEYLCRQSISTLFHDFLACALPIPDAFNSRHAESTRRLRLSFPIN